MCKVGGGERNSKNNRRTEQKGKKRKEKRKRKIKEKHKKEGNTATKEIIPRSPTKKQMPKKVSHRVMKRRRQK